MSSSFWKDDDDNPFEESDRLFDASLRNPPIREVRKPKAMPWNFSLFPLQSKEKRQVIKEGRWSSLKYKPEGSYKISPIKLDILDFQRKYWIYRNCRQIFAILSMEPKAITLSDLLSIRRNIFKYLGNGSKRLSSEQRSLLSQTYYALRRHKSSTRRGKALLEHPPKC